MRNIFFYFLFFCFFLVFSQENRVLFSVSESNTSVDDFIKNYNKNRLDSDTLSFEDSLEEYLDLYIKFQLKVQEAKSLGLDTLPSFIRELDGYRRQLVKPYLTDSNVSDELLKEAYERLKHEVSVSHILITTNPNDTLKGYNKIREIKTQLENGADFIELAKQFSDDPSVQENHGDLGYFSALHMVYPFESAAYNTPVGSISEPVKTRFGYHILKVNDKRPSRGEVTVSHILISTGEDLTLNNNAMNKINEIYDSLMLGQDFSELAKRYSDDKKSGSKGGRLEPFGTNKMVPSFEEQAFNLDSLNSISKPFETEFGWHIVKLLDKKYLPEFEEIKESLKKKIERDSRSQKTRNIVLDRLKVEWGFVENIPAKNEFYNIINENIFNGYDFSQKINGNGHVLFLFNHQYENKIRYVYQKDFADFFISFQSRLNKNNIDLKTVIDQLYSTFKEQKILEMESNHLESKYDEFRLLYNEYYDGILMYQLQKEKVWDKAISDTLGLVSFYEKNKSDYVWPNRVSVKIYSTKDQKILSRVHKKIRSGYDDDRLLKLINKSSSLNLSSIEDSVFIKGDSQVIDHFIFNQLWSDLEEGEIYVDVENTCLYVLDKIMPSSFKSLNEVRGLVISDYQSFLEKEWLDELAKKHIVVINQELFALAKREEIDLVEQGSKNYIDYSNLSFQDAFFETLTLLGSSKDVYFGWRGQIFTTELAPHVED